MTVAGFEAGASAGVACVCEAGACFCEFHQEQHDRTHGSPVDGCSFCEDDLAAESFILDLRGAAQ